MKSQRTLVLISLTLGVIWTAFAQQPYRGAKTNRDAATNTTQQRNPKTETVPMLPDLVVTAIDYDKASSVTVHVTNQGNGTAKSCYLALMLLSADSPESKPTKTWSVAIPALKAKKAYTATVSIAPYTFVDRAFLARIDRSDQVKESDESNNDRFDHSKVLH